MGGHLSSRSQRCPGASSKSVVFLPACRLGPRRLGGEEWTPFSSGAGKVPPGLLLLLGRTPCGVASLLLPGSSFLPHAVDTGETFFYICSDWLCCSYPTLKKCF